ncbi:hypothetical protein N7504_008729 [Penicillium tannophilum]|nr:hypothetical protein N7504_008729 [Penicillium tannophilum]
MRTGEDAAEHFAQFVELMEGSIEWITGARQDAASVLEESACQGEWQDGWQMVGRKWPLKRPFLAVHLP